MRAHLFSYFVCLSIFISCSKDNEEYHPEARQLQGQWEFKTDVIEYSFPQDSARSIRGAMSDPNSHKEKWYMHPETGKLWVKNRIVNNELVFSEVGKVEFKDDYTKMSTDGGLNWYTKK